MKQKQSVWMDTAPQMPSFPTLSQDEITDILIIGGGMAGLLCAYFLQQAGARYLLCEAATIGSGTTAKTTAVLSAQHNILYQDIIRKFGEENARIYLDANLKALSRYRELAQTIDCDFEEFPSYLYSIRDAAFAKNEIQALRRLGFQAEAYDHLSLPISIASAVKFPGQAQFHPLKFIAGIAQGLNIRERTQIKKIKKTTADTGTYKISANKIIIASHFPILNTHGMYFAKLYQTRSYVVALENAPQYDGTFSGLGESDFYFRNYKNLLLVGGGDHRTGKMGGGFDAIRQFVRENYPDAVEKYAWATQDCMSLDGVPYIGPYSASLSDLFVASGFNEWGMTTSMVAAEILTDLATGKYNPYRKVFDPSRSMLRGQLFTNLGVTALDFIFPTTKRCPHLGCALKWNAAEHSWDCPCHGSRFEESGKLIDNPATGDLDLK